LYGLKKGEELGVKKCDWRWFVGWGGFTFFSYFYAVHVRMTTVSFGKYQMVTYCHLHMEKNKRIDNHELKEKTALADITY
jgi:hypothetical protein